MTDLNQLITVISESIDKLVAVKGKLGELNSLCLNTLEKPQFNEYSRWLRQRMQAIRKCFLEFNQFSLR